MSKISKQQATTIGIAASGVLVIGLLIYFLFFYKKRAKSSTDNATTAYPLKKGSTGDRVSALQSKLNSRLQLLIMQPFVYNGVTRNRIAVDGQFGAETEAAVVWALGTKEVTENQFKTL